MSFSIGKIKAGDIVKVSSNAFNGKLGEMHNGRIVKVIEVSSGDVIVESVDNKNPVLMETYYPITVVEKVS